MFRTLKDIIIETEDGCVEIPEGIDINILYDDETNTGLCVIDEENKIVYILDEESSDVLYELVESEENVLKGLIEGDISIYDVIGEGISMDLLKKVIPFRKISREEYEKKKEYYTRRGKMMSARAEKDPRFAKAIKQRSQQPSSKPKSYKGGVAVVKPYTGKQASSLMRAGKIPHRTRMSGAAGKWAHTAVTRGIRGVVSKLGAGWARKYGKIPGSLKGMIGHKMFKWGQKGTKLAALKKGGITFAGRHE